MAFDKDKPAATTSLRNSNPEILANNSQLQTGINNEHIFSGTASGTQTGDHTQGSARCFSQSGAPATRIDGNGFLSTDLGSLWVDTDDNAVYVLTATAPTWTPVSTEVIATMIAAAHSWADVQTFSVSPAFTLGIIANDAWLQSRNAAGSANVNMVKVDGSNNTTLRDGAVLEAATESGDGDLTIADKGYVDVQGTWVPAVSGAGTGYSAEKSITMPNGVIMKWGNESPVNQGNTTVTFGAAFPNALENVEITMFGTTDHGSPLRVRSKHATDSFVIDNPNGGAAPDAEWFAVGY